MRIEDGEDTVAILKASPDDQALLLRLVEYDTRLQQLEHRAARLPERAELATLAREAESVREELRERTGAAEDARAELARTESDVGLVEARIARDAERLQATASVRDVQALEQELAALRRRHSDLEDIQLAVMERVEDAEAALDEARARAAALEERTREATRRRDDAMAAIETERERVLADRATVAARVPSDLLALYERQRARYGVGASLLRGGVSTASGVALGASDMSVVRAAAPDDVLLCPDSNAILVRTAESGI